MSIPQQNTPATVVRYEELRQHAVERQTLAGRLGLAVLLQQGLAAWVEQWSKMPVPTPVSCAETVRPAPLRDDTSTEVINVLAAMVLSHVQEVHA
ncbi:MAG: hypothetical protein GY906_15260 [bacterium]|nr:hypothetical protein [bacterium]